MTTIPDEIMEQARDVADRLFRRGQYRDWHVAKDPERIIALALQDAAIAAEKRGEERERERAAGIASTFAAKASLEANSRDVGTVMQAAAQEVIALDIAAAIRSGS